MVKYENDCCGCATESYPCLGDGCSFKRVAHFYCDKCKSEVDEGELYEFAGDEMCLECIKAILPVVKAHDY